MPLIEQPVNRDCFVLKDKIQDLIDSRSMSFLDDSVKVLVTKEALDIKEPLTLDNKETSKAREEWMAYKSEGAKKRREHANVVKTN